MRTTLAIALLVALLAAGAGPSRNPAPATPSTPAVATEQIALTAAATNWRLRFERRVVAMVNVHRTLRGCPPVRFRATLHRAARHHSWLMARHRTMSHQLPGEPRLGIRITRAGYTGWRLLGENVAMGYRRPWQVFRAWMRSPAHRRNMLDCRFRHLGVGLVIRNGVPWWTQNFGRQ